MGNIGRWGHRVMRAGEETEERMGWEQADAGVCQLFMEWLGKPL